MPAGWPELRWIPMPSPYPWHQPTRLTELLPRPAVLLTDDADAVSIESTIRSMYEAHVTLADGSDATVKLDASFAITETVQGHG